MWQILLAAAVAGSTGFATKHFLCSRSTDPLPPFPQQTLHSNSDNEASATGSLVENANPLDPTFHPLVDQDVFCESGFGSNSETQDGVFTFSSSGSLRQDAARSRPKNPRKKFVMGRRGSRNGLRVAKAEQGSDAELRSENRKGGRRLPFCLKKRKTNKNVAAKSGFCSSKDNSLFGWGLSFGIIYMMSAGKAEISKLNRTMDETAKVVQELKYELNRRKSSCAHQTLNVSNIDVKSCKMSGKHDEVTLKKTNSGLKDNVNIWSHAVNDGGDCGSSALTEEPDPRVLEMDQLEAELEFELQKLSGCTIDSPSKEEIRPKLDEETAVQLEVPDEGCHGTDGQNFNFSQSHGVLAYELNQKLSHLLIKQQEGQIAELESELQLAQSNLHEKEAELEALKDCVRCLTEVSLSAVSGDETEAPVDPKGTSDWNSNNLDSESKQTVVGVKRPIESESCTCHL